MPDGNKIVLLCCIKLVYSRGVKHMACGLKLAHRRVQCDLWDNFGICEKHLDGSNASGFMNNDLALLFCYQNNPLCHPHYQKRLCQKGEK